MQIFCCEIGKVYSVMNHVPTHLWVLHTKQRSGLLIHRIAGGYESWLGKKYEKSTCWASDDQMMQFWIRWCPNSFHIGVSIEWRSGLSCRVFVLVHGRAPLSGTESNDCGWQSHRGMRSRLLHPRGWQGFCWLGWQRLTTHHELPLPDWEPASPPVKLHMCLPLPQVCSSLTCQLQCNKKWELAEHDLENSTFLSQMDAAVSTDVYIQWTFPIGEKKKEKHWKGVSKIKKKYNFQQHI